jgi:hypothetical protein
MTTRDEARAKCIGAMYEACFEAMNGRYDQPTEIWVNGFTAAFDALHGLATVNLPAATKEMLAVGNKIECGDPLWLVWWAMSAAGDLTNPPEKKP